MTAHDLVTRGFAAGVKQTRPPFAGYLPSNSGTFDLTPQFSQLLVLLGGAFGGKESRNCFLTCAVAVAAAK